MAAVLSPTMSAEVFAEEDDDERDTSSSDAASIYFDTLDELKFTAADTGATSASAAAAATAASSSPARASATSSRRTSNGSVSSLKGSGAAAPAEWASPALWSRLVASILPSSLSPSSAAAAASSSSSFSAAASTAAVPESGSSGDAQQPQHRRELSHEESAELDALVMRAASSAAAFAATATRQGPWGGPPLPVVLAMHGRVDALRRLLASGDVGAVVRVCDATGQDALQAAVRNGHIPAAQLLLHAGASADSRDGRGVPTLMSAVLYSEIDVAVALVDTLLKAGADVDCQNSEDGLTPLMMAALIDRDPICQRLLAAGASVHLRNARQEVALMFAASRGNVRLASALLARGAAPCALNADGCSPLTFAGLHGHVALCDLLLRHIAGMTLASLKDVVNVSRARYHPAPITTAMGDGWRAPCPLIAAAAQGRTEVVQLFLERIVCPTPAPTSTSSSSAHGAGMATGQEPSLFKQRTAVIYAVLAGHGDYMDDVSPNADTILFMAGQGQPTAHVVAWTDTERRSALFAAAEGGHGATVLPLLTHLADELTVLLNYRNATGATAFHAVSRAGTLPGLAVLQRALAAVPHALPQLLDMVDAQLGTAVTAAAAAGHLDMINALIALGASVNVASRPPHAPSPLVAAAKAGHDMVVRALVKYVVDTPSALTGPLPLVAAAAATTTARERRERLAAWINLVDHHGWTALVYAAGNGLKPSVRLLLQHGADVNARGHGLGASALMLAAANGRTTVVPVLIAAGADLRMTTAGNKTALDLARQARRRKTVTLLEEALAQPPVAVGAAPGTSPTTAADSFLGARNSSADASTSAADEGASAGSAPPKRKSKSTPALMTSTSSSASPATTTTSAAAPVAPTAAAAAAGVSAPATKATGKAQPVDPAPAVASSTWAATAALPSVTAAATTRPPPSAPVNVPRRQNSASALPQGGTSSSPPVAAPSSSAPASAAAAPGSHRRRSSTAMAAWVDPSRTSAPGVAPASPTAVVAQVPWLTSSSASLSSVSSSSSSSTGGLRTTTTTVSSTAAITTAAGGQAGHRSGRRQSTSTAGAPNATTPTEVERDRRFESVGKIRYNRSQRLGTGSQGTMVYQGFYGSHPAAIKRMHRIGQGGPLDPVADKEIQVLIALDRSQPGALPSATQVRRASTRQDAWADAAVVSPPPAPLTSQGSFGLLSPLSPRSTTVTADDYAELRALVTEGRSHIVSYYGREENDEYVFLAMEQCAGTLQSLVKNSRAQVDVFSRLYTDPIRVASPDTSTIVGGLPLSAAPGAHPMVAHQTPVELVRVRPTDFARRLIRSVFVGVAYLHSLHIVHNDLKPANVLLTEDYCVKIADMGLAKTLSEDQSSFSFQVAGADGVVVAPTGAGGFFAPEVLREGRKTRMVDVFSLGCLAFFVLTLGGHPFELPGSKGQREYNILNGIYDLSRIAHLPDALDLVQRLIQLEPEHRLPLLDALRHPFFSGLAA